MFFINDKNGDMFIAMGNGLLFGIFGEVLRKEVYREEYAGTLREMNKQEIVNVTRWLVKSLPFPFSFQKNGG